MSIVISERLDDGQTAVRRAIPVILIGSNDDGGPESPGNLAARMAQVALVTGAKAVGVVSDALNDERLVIYSGIRIGRTSTPSDDLLMKQAKVAEDTGYVQGALWNFVSNINTAYLGNYEASSDVIPPPVFVGGMNDIIDAHDIVHGDGGKTTWKSPGNWNLSEAMLDALEFGAAPMATITEAASFVGTKVTVTDLIDGANYKVTIEGAGEPYYVQRDYDRAMYGIIEPLSPSDRDETSLADSESLGTESDDESYESAFEAPAPGGTAPGVLRRSDLRDFMARAAETDVVDVAPVGQPGAQIPTRALHDESLLVQGLSVGQVIAALQMAEAMKVVAMIYEGQLPLARIQAYVEASDIGPTELYVAVDRIRDAVTDMESTAFANDGAPTQASTIFGMSLSIKLTALFGNEQGPVDVPTFWARLSENFLSQEMVKAAPDRDP
uniref:Uncharacterized protein n=1 Tax=viral metagenome TaxID=1070528 RepID=A0A2V0RA03_9ZZZZ